MAGTSEDEDHSKKKQHKKNPSAPDPASEACIAIMAGANPQVHLAEGSMPSNLPREQGSLGNDDNSGKPKAKGKSKPVSKAQSQKRPDPSGMQAQLAAAIKTSSGTYARKSAARGRGGSCYVGRRKGFIDDSELPDDETAEEKKRRLNRNNERRKRARRVVKIDFLSERKGALAEKNQRIRNDNEALRNHIAIIRERLQSGGSLADIDIAQGATSILSAAEAAALAASTPSPPVGLESPGSQVSSTRAVPRAPDAHSLTETGAVQAREALSPAAGKGSPQHAARGLPHAGPEQSMAHLPPLPLTGFHSALGANSPLSIHILEALQRETLMQGRLDQESGLAFASQALGAATNVYQNAFLASLRQDNALPRLGTLGGLTTTAEISRLWEERLQAQHATTVNPSVASLSGNRLPTGLMSGFGRQLPDLTRRSSDQMLSATLQQQLFDLSSRTPTAAAGLRGDMASQLRSQFSHQSQVSTSHYSGLLSHLSGGQPQHPTDPFLLAVLQQQQQQQQPNQLLWSSAASQGPRSPSATRLGGNLLHAENVFNTLMDARGSSGLSSLGAAGSLAGGFRLQPSLNLGSNRRDASSLSLSQREAALMQLALLTASEQRNQEATDRLIVAGGGDTKRDDDDAENSQPRTGQDPYSARPQS
jgi:hypothetical protein